MKICKRGLYIQVIDGIGTVRACAWAGYYKLGNLRDSSVYEIFNSEAARQFRKTLIDGTYDFCNEENCPYMANNTLESNMVEVEEIPEYPETLHLAYDRRCNYHCTCCCSRNDNKMDFEVQKKVENEIRKVLPYIKEFSANGLGEIFCSDSMLKLISDWKPKNIEKAEFHLETNGSLFTPENWEKISNIGNAFLTVAVTIHSFEEEAYQYLSGTKIKIEKIFENLKFIKKLRKEGKINFLNIATVMQERNFRTLPEFVERALNEFDADQVRIRRFLPEKAMDENIEWFFDIRNPLHPYHQEYLSIMKHPIFNDSRVFNWTGDHLSSRGEIPAKANYRIMKDLFLIENIGEKLEMYFKSCGYTKIILYAITDVGKALMKVLENTTIEIIFIYDRNSELEEWNGLKVRKPLHENLRKTNEPLVVTLISRYNEMEEFIKHRGYKGDIINLDNILEGFR